MTKLVDLDLGVLAFRGPDAAKFLQGQLSADTEKLVPGASVRAGLHNPQGRVIALLTLARTSSEEILATVPRELVTGVTALLRKYVFRSKVRIESAELRAIGAPAGADPRGSRAFGWGDRQLLLASVGLDLDTSPDAAAWQLADVRQGFPEVYAATSETFVAQMLNLDLLGAIAFDKGCYTGQEVIARAHYRGKVKRRLQRWLNTGRVALAPGDAARGPDGRALTVVRVAVGPEGQEVLAVGTFAAATEPAPPEAASPVHPENAATLSGPLALPYSLPE